MRWKGGRASCGLNEKKSSLTKLAFENSTDKEGVEMGTQCRAVINRHQPSVTSSARRDGGRAWSLVTAL